MRAPTDAELHELLRPLRPDPQAFRARTLEKAAARTRSAPPLRQAASCLPLGWFAGGCAPRLAASARLDASLVGLPVITLGMAALAFLYGLRAALGLRGSAPRAAEAEALVRAWWREHAAHALATLALLLVLALFCPLEALVLVFLASMVHVAAVLTRLGSAGAASRHSIGRFTGSFLGLLLLGLLLTGEFARGLRTHAVPEAWVPLLLAVGSVVCGLAAEWRPSDAFRRRLLRVILPIAGTLALAAWLALRTRPVDEARLRSWLAQFDRPLTETPAWNAAGTVSEVLHALDRGPVDAARARSAVEALLSAPADPERALAEQGSLLAAARGELVPPTFWAELRAEPDTQALLHDAFPLAHVEALELRLVALARGPASATERESLASRLHAAWPAPDAARAFERMAVIVSLLRRLRSPLPIDELQADVHAVLLDRWRGPHVPAAAPAGFVRSDTVADTPELASIHQVEPTRRALHLMAVFGLPTELDLQPVTRFLQRTATPSLIEALSPRAWPLLTIQPYRFQAAATLLELEHSNLASPSPRFPQSPPATWLAHLAAERLLVLSTLLVLVCLAATLRAPAERRVGPGSSRQPLDG